MDNLLEGLQIITLSKYKAWINFCRANDTFSQFEYNTGIQFLSLQPQYIRSILKKGY